MARPRKIKTAEELGVLIDEFIMQCEDGKQYMDDYALMKFLGNTLKRPPAVKRQGRQ